MERPISRTPICDYFDRVTRAADRDDRADINPGAAGQGIGMVRTIRPAAEVFADLVRGARQILDHDLDAMVGTQP